MFSEVPAVSPILNAPAWTPPTVAGPMIVLPTRVALAISLRVSFSGTPSAIITTVRIDAWSSASDDDGYADRCDAKLRKTSAPGCCATASSIDPKTGIMISFVPKKTLWLPASAPGATSAAIDGIARRHMWSKSSIRCTGSGL
eukprot:Amastigsp_a841279_504.p5 type:complete len:143 gc:universal Amastigsp_a841279_504:537-109(-)